MYQIKLVNKRESKLVHECMTLVEAKMFYNDFSKGRGICDEEDENSCRLETYEILPDGNLECVNASDYFEGI